MGGPILGLNIASFQKLIKMWWRKPGDTKSRKNDFRKNKKCNFDIIVPQIVRIFFPSHIYRLHNRLYISPFLYLFLSCLVRPTHAFYFSFHWFCFPGSLLSARIVFFFFCWINVSRSSHCKLKSSSSSSSSSCFFFHFFFLFILWALLQLLFSKIIAVAMGS
jgi:hypothetical protein